LAPLGRKFQAPTAYSRTRVIEEFEDGSVLLGLRQWDCWGIEYWGGERRIRTRFKKGEKAGLHNFVTLEMQQAGCCPPELMKDYIMQEGGELVERDPLEEAMELHKRGYFGGGG
jgi:hypothetical protein